jgi:hypothetical protein
MENDESIDSLLLKINNQLSIFEKEELKSQLIFYINHLLLNDFNKLVWLLYKVDVNEEKLKMLIQESPQTDAAILISELLIQRQQEKIISKQNFKPTNDIAEEEKW